MARIRSTFFSGLLALLVGACVTTATPPPANYGIQPGVESYVPARIAVAPCQTWPSQAAFNGVGNLTISPEERAEICSALDDYVLRGFANQPYLHGYTPKVISELLQKGDHVDFLTQWETYWSSAEKCEDCVNPVGFYNSQMAAKASWLQWLNDLSRFTRHCDALLLPLVLSATSAEQNDRGLRKSKKELAIAMLLIDTNNGKLIWAQARSSGMHNESLQGEFPAFPPWSALAERLFTEALWKEFPGRLIY